MIWEQNVHVIVMVTQLSENNRVSLLANPTTSVLDSRLISSLYFQDKCAKYWPDQGEAKFYGDVKVSLRSESVINHYTVRVLDVSYVSDPHKIPHLLLLPSASISFPLLSRFFLPLYFLSFLSF